MPFQESELPTRLISLPELATAFFQLKYSPKIREAVIKGTENGSFSLGHNLYFVVKEGGLALEWKCGYRAEIRSSLARSHEGQGEIIATLKGSIQAQTGMEPDKIELEWPEISKGQTQVTVTFTACKIISKFEQLAKLYPGDSLETAIDEATGRLEGLKESLLKRKRLSDRIEDFRVAQL